MRQNEPAVVDSEDLLAIARLARQIRSAEIGGTPNRRAAALVDRDELLRRPRGVAP